MVIKIHGSKGSSCTQRVLTALFEKNVEHELIAVDFTVGEHKSPPFLALQPFGKVPVLEDDGFILFESRAICKYIARKYAGQGTPLLPAADDLKGNALFDQACSVETFHFDPAVSGICFEKLFKGLRGLGEADEARVAALVENLDATLAIYEGILSKQKYLAGDELTLADLFHIPYGNLTQRVGFASNYDKYPHVKAWLDGLLAREAWVKAST